MTDILLGLASLVPVTLIGCMILWTLDRQGGVRTVEGLALGYGIGAGFLAWEMVVFELLGLSLTTLGVLAPLLGLTALVFLARRRWVVLRTMPSPGVPTPSLQPLERLLTVSIAFEMSRAFFRAGLLPMEAYDAVSNWGLKGKAIFLTQSIPESFLLNPNYQVFHPDYPLLAPLLEGYVYGFVRGLREGSAKIAFPLFMVGCVVVLFSALRRAGQTRRSCLLFSFLLVSIPYFSEHATNGYVDVTLSFYFGAGTLYLYLWQTTGRDLFLILSALFTGFAALTKNEGLLLVAIHIITLAVLLRARPNMPLRNRMVSLGIYVCLLAAILMPWYVFKDLLGLRNDVINSESLGAGLSWKAISRLGPILYHFQTQVFGPKNWNLVWILLAVTLSLRLKWLLRARAVPVLFVTAVVLAAYGSVYLVTPYTIAPFDVTWHLRTSASRLMLHVLVQVVFLIGLALGEAEIRPTMKQLEV